MKYPGKPIAKNDEADFYLMLQISGVDSTRFENHWPYIIQATRNSGYVYKYNQTRIYYFIRNHDGYGELVIVNCFGEDKAKAISRLKEYTIENKISFCIKNISIEELPYWQGIGYREKTCRWSEYSIKDDNSYPECIYSLKVLALAHMIIEPDQLRKCRASHANRLRKFIRERKIHIEKYEPTLHKNAVYQLLLSNAEFLQNKGVDSMQNVIDAHLFVFDDELQYKIRLVHIENENIIGFNYITHIGDTIFGNALIHQNSPDLMRFLVWQGFNYLYHHLDKNKKYCVTLQGCENKGQYHWKKGFASLKEIIKTHII